MVTAQLGSVSGPSRANPSPWCCCALPGAYPWPRGQRVSWSLCKASSSPLPACPGPQSCQWSGDWVHIPAAGTPKLVWCVLLSSRAVVFCADAHAGATAGLTRSTPTEPDPPPSASSWLLAALPAQPPAPLSHAHPTEGKGSHKAGVSPRKQLFSAVHSQGIGHRGLCLLRGRAGIFLCIISWCCAKGWKFILKIHNSCLKCLCLVPAIPPEWPRDIYKTSIIF